MNEKPIILIVDDVIQNIQIISNILKKENIYDLIFALNGEEALELTGKLKPDLILLDIVMPGMNGFQTCEALKASLETRNIPVVFLTSKTETGDIVKGFEMGAVDYITKPFQKEVLLARVKNHLKLKQTEERLRETLHQYKIAKEITEKASRAKSIFLSNMSHELRTPLNIILGFSRIISRSQELTPGDKENAEIIIRSGERLLGLINNILNLSKIKRGHIRLNETSFDLYLMLDNLEDIYRTRALKKGLQLIFERSPDLPRFIRADDIRLRNILSNLLDNAVKYTEKGGVSLRVSVIKEPSEIINDPDREEKSQFLHFEVEDTGPGIAQEEWDALFEAFVQIRAGEKSQEGPGLGLPISYGFVKLMGGEMTVTSEPGRGSLFSFHIQAGVADQTDIRKSLPEQRIIALEPDQPRYRILITDDEWDSRELLVRLLNPLGFEIREAANGKECIEIWKTWRPHLIWMDMQMPVMDGYEATKKIRELETRNPEPESFRTVIIALTAGTFEEERAVLLSVGCDDFLRRPFWEAELFNLMGNHLGIRYICDKTAENKYERKNKLVPADLSALTSDILIKMEQAALIADIKQIFRIIDEIRSYNPVLAEGLSQIADDFDYSEILALIKKFRDSESGEADRDE